MSLETVEQLVQRAQERKGSSSALKALLSTPKSQIQLSAEADSAWLSAFSKKVFQSGFVWRVVEDKWPNFEKAFFGFDVEKVLLMPDEMLEQKASDPSIIRNFKKVMSIRENALMMQATKDQYGSFSQFIAQWPSDDIIGLWAYLKQHGCRLGGNTGPYALRAMGKDTFILSNDVVGYFKAREIITGSATSKRSLNAIQDSFNQWQSQSEFSLQELSRIVAFGVGDNHVFPA